MRDACKRFLKGKLIPNKNVDSIVNAVHDSDQAGCGYELRLQPFQVASGLPKASATSGGSTSNRQMCCEVCDKTFKQRHSVQQHMAAVHDVAVSAAGIEVCPMLGGDGVLMFGPKTLECVLRGAHGIAHRSSDSMARWLSRQGMTWSGAAKACRCGRLPPACSRQADGYHD